MAKSKKERRNSIRHMAADDAFRVLEALDRVEQQERSAAAERTPDDESETDEEPAATSS